MTNEQPVWTYWEGNKSPLWQLCFDTFERHNQDFRIITPEFIKDQDGGEELWDFAAPLPIPQRADLMRLFILQRFGGIWTDADCIQTAPFDFHESVPDVDLLGVYNPTQRRGFAVNGLLATPWACPPDSQLVKLGFDECKRLLKLQLEGNRVPYGQTSVGILSWLYRSRKDAYKIERRQHWKYNRIPWYNCRKALYHTAPTKHHEEGKWWVPHVVSYHITNVLTKLTLDQTREQILQEGNRKLPLYSFLFQKSLGLHPATLGRSREILDRLPSGPCKGVEVGVLKGMNARHLLQQRKDLEMILVDPWGLVPDEAADYKRTRDYQSRFTQDQWNRVFNFVGRNLAFAESRFRRIRKASKDALADVPDHSLDFAFLDGNHSYPAVKRDLDWSQKVKEGGWIGGHDYNHRKNKSGKYGVNQAVDEFAKLINATVQTGIDYTWFIQL